MEKACWFGLKRNIHGRRGKSRRKAEIEPMRERSLPCAGWRLWAWSWLVSGNRGKRGKQGGFASRRWSGRRSGRDGGSARTGSTLPPAHGFSTLSLTLQPIRDEPSESFAARPVAQPRVHRCRRGLEGQPQSSARTAALCRILLSEPRHAGPASCPAAAGTASGPHNRRLGRVPRETGQLTYGSA